jgi:DUF4097 and DUF4098 domain-containing protein YvlB
LEELHHNQKHKKFYEEEVIHIEEKVPYIIEAKLFPLGWSKDEKFAYIIEHPDEAIGELRATMYVIDIKTNKILEQLLFKNQFNFEKIEQLIKQYAINLNASMAINTFPLRFANTELKGRISA